MRPSRIVLAAVLAASFAVGCNKQTSPATSPTTAAASGGSCDLPADQVVATFKVDGAEQKVTYGELTGRIGPQLTDLEKKKQELLKRGLEGFVIEKLVQAEAKKRGMANEDALLKAEVEDKVPQPSDDEIKKVYDQAKASGQLPEQVTVDQVKPDIIKMLTEQTRREKAQALFADLKSKADVTITLPEKRTQVEAIGPSKGPENAPVTIVEFSDFQCPFCGKAKGTVDEVVKQYGDKVRLVFRHFPLSFHENAPKAAEAAACAQDQGKFWEMHDALYANGGRLAPADLVEVARRVGLDVDRFRAELLDGAYAGRVARDEDAARAAGIASTPTFIVNGVPHTGAFDAGSLVEALVG